MTQGAWDTSTDSPACEFCQLTFIRKPEARFGLSETSMLLLTAGYLLLNFHRSFSQGDEEKYN